MAGHNKWSKIHRQKSVADNKRGAFFTKLGNAITIAAREGGGDPETNFKLRLAIDKAKTSNMPKENIERSIKRGTGELSGGNLEEIIYEGFGPHGTAFIVQTLTDNKNRTGSSVKHIFSKHGGNLGGPGSVSWMFEQKGVIRTTAIDEATELALIDAGATDFETDDGKTTVYTEPTELQKVKSTLEIQDLPIEYAEIEFIAKERKSVPQEAQAQVDKLFEALDEDEDVNTVYTNADA